MGALLYNFKAVEPIRVVFEETSHPQQATPMQTDNSTLEEIVNDTIQVKGKKSMDIQLYWYKIESARAATTCFVNQ